MRKGQLLEAILEQKDAKHKDGWNVATSQRRYVGCVLGLESVLAWGQARR